MRIKKLLSLLAFPCLFLALLVLTFVLRRQLFELFSSPQALREWIRATGVVAPLVFVAVQAFQVVFFFIPGEIPQVAGGYAFGLWMGTVLSVTGITLGATFNFVIARILGVPFVNALFTPQKVEQARKIATSPKARLSFFLFFLIPGIPKDILCYVAGLSIMKLHFFLLYSTLGRIPGIIGSALIGNAAADRRWILAGTVFFIAAALFVLGFLLRERIQHLLEGIGRRPRRGRRT
ncbi:MAG: TVP38/TMEM64 family protein [Spirochaetaceae bacterium]|nr:MAG: TVP38/TMEM64 family protein [Spirochaetaceae bacterium]